VQTDVGNGDVCHYDIFDVLDPEYRTWFEAHKGNLALFDVCLENYVIRPFDITDIDE